MAETTGIQSNITQSKLKSRPNLAILAATNLPELTLTSQWLAKNLVWIDF
jgi:hypothetical protein